MKKNKIILAEDNLADVELVKITLRELYPTINLVIVSDGQELLDYFDNSSISDISLILMDLNMPRLGGLDVLNATHSHPILSCLPIVVFTTSANKQDIMRCYELGAKAYICKPLDIIEFNDSISHIVEFWTTINILPALA